MDRALFDLPVSSYWVVIIWAFVVFVVWYFYRHAGFSKSSLLKIVSALSILGILLGAWFWYQSRPKVNLTRIAVLPFPRQADSSDVVSWESLAVSEITSEQLNLLGPNKILAYDLESIWQMVNFDSLAEEEFVVPFARKVQLDYVIFGKLTREDSGYLCTATLVELANPEEPSAFASTRAVASITEIASELYSQFLALASRSTNGANGRSRWAQQAELEPYYNAKLFALSNQTEAAIELAEAVVRQDSSSVKGLNLLAQLLIAEGMRKKTRASAALDEFRTAKSLLTKSLQRQPNLSTTHRLLSELYRANEKWLMAERSLARARDLQPLDPRVYLDMTRLHPSRFRKWDFKSEADLLEHAINLNGGFMDAYLQLANYYKRKRRERLALTTVEQARTINPNHVPTLMLLGSLHLAKNRTLEVLEAYQKVLNLEPGNSDVYYNLGIAYYYAKDLDNAVKYFDHALALDDHLDSHLYLAYIYELKGETDKAIEHLRARIKKRTGDNDKFAEEARKHLFNIMSAQGAIDSLMAN